MSLMDFELTPAERRSEQAAIPGYFAPVVRRCYWGLLAVILAGLAYVAVFELKPALDLINESAGQSKPMEIKGR